MNNRVSAYAPGKMYILGEYAVVYEGFPAIITSLNKGVHVFIEPSQHYEMSSSKFKHEIITLSEKNKRLYTSDRRFSYALEAINTILPLCKEITPFKLTIESELDHPNQKKYGFGSSGAMIVAIVKALSLYFDINFSKMDIFKLSVITQFSISKYSSFGDLAVSCFGGMLYYQKGKVDWLAKLTTQEALEETWDDFKFEPLPSFNVNYCIGYTKQHALSTKMVKQVQTNINLFELNDFLEHAKIIVEEGKHAIMNNKVDDFLKAINEYRHLLVQLSQRSGISIETPLIQNMIDQANHVGASAKTSGAGGGDCVIGFSQNAQIIAQCKEVWKQLDVEIVESIEWEK